MGPMFYLVQCEGELLPISAVLLADWPHEFQPWPCDSGAGDGATHRGSGPLLSARVEGLGRRFFGRFSNPFVGPNHVLSKLHG